VAAHVVPALLMARCVLARPLPTAALDDLRSELAFAFQASVAHPAASRTRARNVVDLFVDDESRVVERAQRIVDDPSAAADGMIAATVLSNLAWASGRLDDGLRWGREALARLTDDTPRAWAPYPALALATKLIDAGEFADARVLIDGSVGPIDPLATQTAHADAAVARGRLLLAAGDTARARDVLSDARTCAARLGAHWAVADALFLLAMAELRLGDPRAASDHMWQCRLELASDHTLFPSTMQAWGEYLVASAYLTPERAAGLMTSTYADLLARPALLVEDTAAAPWLVRLALAAGDLLLATTVVATAERLAADNPDHVAVGVAAAHARALMQDDAPALEYAADAHRNAWAAELALGDLRALRDAPSAPTPAPTAPVAEPAPVDEPADIAEPFRPAPPPEAGLTETERRIVELVADGMTNQQVARALYRSPHTVNYHLRRIFRKLGVTSRVELAKYVYGADS
jgi:DNA-binding CsgD family transcriptional regulator